MDFFAKLNRGFHRGFTLPGVLVRVFTLGIVATLALPAIHAGLEESKFSGAAGEITAALEYARFIARVSREQTRVTIDAANDTILVERSGISSDITGAAAQFPENGIDTEAFVTAAHPTSRGKDYYIVFAEEDRLKKVDIASATFGAGNSVTFNADGVPSDGGRVTLSRGGMQVDLTLDPVSGEVTSGS